MLGQPGFLFFGKPTIAASRMDRHLVKCAFEKHPELGGLASPSGNTLQWLVLSGGSQVAIGSAGCLLSPMGVQQPLCWARQLLPEAWALGPFGRPACGTGVRCPLTHRWPGHIMPFSRPLNFTHNRKSGERTPEAPPSSQTSVAFMYWELTKL